MVYSDDVASPSSPSALFFLMSSFVFITEEEDVASNPRVVVLLSHLRFLFASLQPQQCYPLVRYALLFLILYLQEKTRHSFHDEPIEWNDDASLLLVLKLSMTASAAAVLDTVTQILFAVANTDNPRSLREDTASNPLLRLLSCLVNSESVLLTPPTPSIQWIEHDRAEPITAKLLIRRQCIQLIQYGSNARKSCALVLLFCILFPPSFAFPFLSMPFPFLSRVASTVLMCNASKLIRKTVIEAIVDVASKLSQEEKQKFQQRLTSLLIDHLRIEPVG
ncbi:hypothetical protein WA556_003415 [Blastocystis sp. ATCC 50177/Nand II]